jgi:hypothetical protein
MSFLHPLSQQALQWLRHPRLPAWAAGVWVLSFAALVAMAVQQFLGLPFEIRVDRYMVNSDFVPRRSDPKLREEAADLIGLPPEMALAETEKSGGAKSEMNIASAYLSIREKKTSKELGRFAVTQFMNDPMIRPVPILNQVESDGRSFELALRCG